MAYAGGGGAGGGGAGARGGGSIKLVASTSMVIPGSIITKGEDRVRGNGSNGASTTGTKGGNGGGGGGAGSSGSSTYGTGGTGRPCENSGGTGGIGGYGGRGAGGGLCLVCEGPFGIKLSGYLDTRGGGNNTSNFGSVKTFKVKNAGSTTGNIYGGWNDTYGTPYSQENKTWIHVC